MISLSELEQYFPKIGEEISIKDYTFKLKLDEDSDTFIINLKVTQLDTKENHLIKFRLGLGKDKPTSSQTHKTNVPHFEIDLYKREAKSQGITLYFTLDATTQEDLKDYAKGTIVVISNVIEHFIKVRKLGSEEVAKLIYAAAVKKELGSYEAKLIDALYGCYKNHELTAREDSKVLTLKTPHAIESRLSFQDIQPLKEKLMSRIEKGDS